MRSIYFKELSAYFSSPAFYIIAGIFLSISGIYFFHTMSIVSLAAMKIAQNQAVSMNDVLIRPIFSDLSMLIIFFTPMISMGLYAQERVRGTIELLFSYPVSDLDVLLGKYLAALSIFAVILSITVSFMAVISAILTPDWGVIVSSYVGIFLLGAAILSMGMFATVLTNNQTAAAVSTIGLTLAFWTIGWFSGLLSGSTAGTVLQAFSFVNHLSPFLRGTISLTDLYFFAGTAFFFLALAFSVLNMNRKKG